MKIYKEISIANFDAWGGAEDTLDRIINANKADELESILEEEYPDGIDQTNLNDILRYESDWIYEMLGMKTDEEIKEELEELRQELAELNEQYAEECEELREENPDLTFGELEALRDELWTDDYVGRYMELTTQIEELEDELNGI